jgi:hypothetical protein
VITLVKSASSYFLESFKYGLVSFNGFLNIKHCTMNGKENHIIPGDSRSMSEMFGD